MLSVQDSIPAFVSTQVSRNSSGQGFVISSGSMNPILPAYRGLLTGADTANNPILCEGATGSAENRQCLRTARSQNIESDMVAKMYQWAIAHGIRPEYFGIQLLASGARGRRVALLTCPSVSPA